MEPVTSRTAPNAVDRRRARTRAALLNAGRALLAHRGVDALSVDEIVAAADVAKGSFYNHFADKNVFAREIGAAVRRQAEAAIARANKGVEDPALRLAQALCVFIRFAIEHRDSAEVLWRLNSGATMVDAPINRGLRDEVSRACSTLGVDDFNVETGMLLVMGTIIIALRHVLEERAVTPPPVIAARMSAGMLRALGFPARRAASLARRASVAVFA